MASREDPFPLVNLELGFLKKPIICFGGSGGSREFVEDDCGYVIDGFDICQVVERIKELAGSQELRKRLGEKANEKVRERYDGRMSVSMICEIIKEVYNKADKRCAE